MRAYSLEDDENTTLNDDASPSQEEEAEYVFEGFKVDFSEKVALTPPETAKGQAAA